MPPLKTDTGLFHTDQLLFIGQLIHDDWPVTGKSSHNQRTPQRHCLGANCFRIRHPLPTGIPISRNSLAASSQRCAMDRSNRATGQLRKTTPSRHTRRRRNGSRQFTFPSETCLRGRRIHVCQWLGKSMKNQGTSPAVWRPPESTRPPREI